MRTVRLFIAVACVLFTAHSVFAQGWTEYTNREDRFTVAAPMGNPTVEKIKWKSEYESMFPANVYKWQVGPNQYSVTVVDYSESEALFTANNRSEDFQGTAYWQIDILGSVQYAATTKYRLKPGVKLTYDAFHYINLITGHELQLTNPDASRTYVGIYLHENRLYIFDATVAKGMPPPLIFQQTPSFLDAEGKNVRYRTYYYNKLPETKLGPGRPGAGGTGGVGTTEQGVGGGGGRGGAPQGAPPAAPR